MSDFTFVTSNDTKVHVAKAACDELGISFDRASIDFVEIQSTDAEAIARHKAEQAFAELQKPVVVTDDSWLIPALNGFPGPYMKQVNDWFSTDDWLRLMHDSTERRVIIRQIVVYQDIHKQRLFVSDLEAVMLREARGNAGNKVLSIISFDNGKQSAAEVFETGESAMKHLSTSWHELCTWLKKA